MSGARGEAADGGDVHPEDEHASGPEGGTEPTSTPDERAEPAEGIDLVAVLGASVELSPQVLRLYIPNRDRHSSEFGCQRKWVLEAANLLAIYHRGRCDHVARGGGRMVRPGQRHDRVGESDSGLHLREARPLREAFAGTAAIPPSTRSRDGSGRSSPEFDGDFYRINQYDPSEKT